MDFTLAILDLLLVLNHATCCPLQNQDAVSSALIKEIERGHTSGSFSLPPFQILNCSPLGAVPKKYGTRRIILDLPSPRHQSMDDGISNDEFSIKYSSFDDAVDLMRQLGVRYEIGKLDDQQAWFSSLSCESFGLAPLRHALG